MPISRTLSPAVSESASIARVNGTEAGPMLPRVGNVLGALVGSMSSAWVIAAVCALEIWWEM